MGLLVDDAKATVERATALGSTPFQQPVGPGELEIPAIRSVGGGLLHFIDQKNGFSKVWESEFQAIDEESDFVPAGLSSIDHIAQTMKYEEMLTWSLFYISLFDVAKQPMVDVVDPGGLVRSQAIESPDGALRLTLNGAESHRTFAGRFIAASFGSSVQHVAFETSDIFAAARALAANGFEPLVIPRNYYDDLASRFGLDEAYVQQLHAQNLLFDQVGETSFLQLYSKPFGDGIFFEIVERREGYGGYGGPNAPYRVAAQARLMRQAETPRNMDKPGGEP